MNFNSPWFFIFLLIVFFGHWLLCSKNKSSQNLFLLLASYFFYAYAQVSFVLLLAFSTCLNFYTGAAIENTTGQRQKRLWLRFGVVMNLAVLAYFKYTGFLLGNLGHSLHIMGIAWDTWSLRILLPIGISFYTFHGLSYILDIYYRRIKPDKNLADYALFVSFFPLLLAGPIERATHLLPQLKQKRAFNYDQAVAGLRLILWGTIKKVVIADSLAPTVNYIFGYYEHLRGITLLLGVIGFSFQIYADFSGYSDIARGVAKLFGIEVFNNFNFPFFSRNISEFWGRWHISLSTWLNDYVYLPLSIHFRNGGRNGVFLSIMITFILSGFWHGAAWHFVAWGALHGLYYIPLVYGRKGSRAMINSHTPMATRRDAGKILATYGLVCLAFVFFRANSIGIAFHYLWRIATSIVTQPMQLLHEAQGQSVLLYAISLLVCEYLLMRGIAWRILAHKALRIATYLVLIELTLYHMSFFNSSQSVDFIYFQF